MKRGDNIKSLRERLINLLDRRISVTEATKKVDYQHVISNASLEDIRRGINKVYNQVNGARDENEIK